MSVIVFQLHGDQWKVVDCASRFLTPTEQNYHPIEMEMLAITWGCHRMGKYLHGLPHFVIETDHKPLIPILNTRLLSDMSPRIQRMRMKLLRFRFTVIHIAGKDNIDADAFSRAPVSQPTSEDELAEQQLQTHVNSVIRQLPATDQRLEEIRRKTKTDKTLEILKDTVRKGWPSYMKLCLPVLQPYWTFLGDISFIEGLLLYRDRIIIPSDMRKDILDKIHVGHLGMDKCKRRARESVFWPGLTNQIEQKVSKCETCLRYLPSKPKEPMLPHEVPTKPWEKVATDLFHYANRDYIIIVDYYSLWPEVYLLKKAQSANVIEACKDSFSRHGVPKQLV